jgi:hypothetical protein
MVTMMVSWRIPLGGCLVLSVAAIVTVDATAMHILSPGFTVPYSEGEGEVQYWTCAIRPSEDTSVYLALTQVFGAATFYATPMYDGTPSTLPGPGSHVCQWKSSVVGSSASAMISTRPNMSSPGGCPDIASWLQPLNLTIATVVEQGQALSPLHSSLATFGLAVHTPAAYNNLKPTFFSKVTLPTPVYDRQMVDAYSVDNYQRPGVALAVPVDRYTDMNPQNSADSALITISPLLSDGDYTVFVSFFDDIGPAGEPICEDPSSWPSPSEPICTNWAWSFSTTNGRHLIFNFACAALLAHPQSMCRPAF